MANPGRGVDPWQAAKSEFLTMPTGLSARTATFLTLAFVLSWTSFLVLRPLVPAQAGVAVYVVFMFGPLIAALITATIFDRGRVVATLALRPRFNLWWIVAWLAPGTIVGLAFAISLLMPGATPQSLTDGIAAAAQQQGVALDEATLAQAPPAWVVILGSMVAGGAINTFAAIGEEAGWRGYLWTELRSLGFWPAVLVTGIAWGLWHAPVIAAGHNYGLDYAGYPWLGIGTMVLFTLGLSPILGLLRDRTGTSWAPALFHGTINAMAGLVAIVIAGGHPLLVGAPGIAGVIALALVTLAVVLLRPASTAPVDPETGAPRPITAG